MLQGEIQIQIKIKDNILQKGCRKKALKHENRCLCSIWHPFSASKLLSIVDVLPSCFPLSSQIFQVRMMFVVMEHQPVQHPHLVKQVVAFCFVAGVPWPHCVKSDCFQATQCRVAFMKSFQSLLLNFVDLLSKDLCMGSTFLEHFPDHGLSLDHFIKGIGQGWIIKRFFSKHLHVGVESGFLLSRQFMGKLGLDSGNPSWRQRRLTGAVVTVIRICISKGWIFIL